MKTEINFNKAKYLLREGDVLLFRGRSGFSFLIKRASEGKYSHVGVVSGHGDNGSTTWECVEFLEGAGGRSVNLETYLGLYKGTIDVYRPSSTKEISEYNAENGLVTKTINFNGKSITNIIRKMTGLPYGWKRILLIAQMKVPLLRWFYSMDKLVDDSIDEIIYPVCSTIVAYAFNHVGYDLVHHRSTNYTEPSDIARSPLLSYLFTLKK